MNRKLAAVELRVLAAAFLFALSVGCLVSASHADDATSAGDVSAISDPVSFDEQVEPIFRRHCYGCHQGAKQLGSYVMTDFASLIQGGETGQAAIVAGKPEESYLLSQITPVEGIAEMPKSPAKPLSVAEVELIHRWISEGAVNDSEASTTPKYDPSNPPVYTGSPSITSIDVSPDGQQIAIAGYYEVLLVDAETAEVAQRLIGMSPRINSVRFSPDGKRLAAVGGTPGLQGEVQVWDPIEGQLLLSLPVTYDALCGAGWSPDSNKLAFGATDNVVRAINAETGEQLLYQGAHEDWIRDVAFTPDGSHVVSVARDMSCKLTDVETERFIDNITSITPGALSGGLNSVEIHPTRNEIVIGGADGVTKVYRIFRETARKIGDDANLIRKLPALPGRIFDVAINQDASRIAAAATLDNQSEIRVWSYDFDGTLDKEIKAIIAKRVYQRSEEEKKKVEAYRKSDTRQIAAISLKDVSVYAIAFCPDHSFLVAASDGMVRHYDEAGQLKRTIDVFQTIPPADGIATHFDPRAWQPEGLTQDTVAVDPATIESITVTPDTAEWTSPYDYTQVVVTGFNASGEAIDLTRVSQYRAPDFAVASDRGVMRPFTDGTGKLGVRFGNHQASIDVSARDVDHGKSLDVGAVDFVRDVNPVLSRLGCNQGTCHGAQKGKAGFKLSLRGYDPVFDLRALTDDLAARRINPAAPEQSLMLRKPLGEIPHQGGALMTAGDPYHAVLRRWIADGSDLNLKTAKVERLEVFPINPVVQTIGTRQQVRLVAHYTDGTKRDVTAESFIESGNSEVATAADGGLLTAVRRGEAAILARYEGNYVATTLTVMGNRDEYQDQQYETWNEIDEWVAKKWKRVKVQPSGLCDDATFLRRVTLDLTGLPPTSDEVRAFLADPTPTREKRARMVDRLLGSVAYVDYWTNKWADLLQVNRKFLGVEGSVAFRDWIRASVSENVPYDEFAREILTASGSNKDNPAASYYKVLRTPEDTMENTTHLFLGIRFNCNKCHDHPFERWTQDQYYELAAFFGQVALKADPKSGKKKIGGTAVEGAKPLYEVVFDKQDGEIEHGRTGDVAAPQFPYEVPCDIPEDGTRRERLATWMTSPENPYFARSFVNRLWGYLLGVGLIEPIDDIRAGNPPTNPELLNHLTDHFIESGFDARSILRHICNSRTYQLGVETRPLNEDDTINYARAIPRRLPAEVIYDAVHALTGSVSDIPGMPKGTRAAALTDSGVKLADGFLQNLGRPARESACECERSSELQLGPIMALIGGPTIASAISDPKNELERIVQENPDDRRLATEIFLRSLGRKPTEMELTAFDEIKRQIQGDHEALVAELEREEARWKQRKAELEQQRLAKLAAAEKELAARIEAAKPKQQQLAEQRDERIAKATAALNAIDEKLSERLKAWEAKHSDTLEWHPLRATKATSTNKATLVAQSDRSILASGKKTPAVYTIEYPTNLDAITGFRLETLRDPELPGNGPGLPENGNFVITEFEIQVASAEDPKTFRPVKIASGKADFLQQNFTIEATFDGQKRGQGGWAVAGATGLDHWATFKLDAPIENTEGAILRIQIHQFHNAADHRLGRFRISATTSEGEIGLGLPETLRSIVSTPEADRSDEAKRQLSDYFAKVDSERINAVSAVAAAKAAVPPDEETVRLTRRRDALKKPTPDDPRLLRLRSDVTFSKQQLERIRLTAAEDLTWALINSPAFLFNH